MRTIHAVVTVSVACALVISAWSGAAGRSAEADRLASTDLSGRAATRPAQADDRASATRIFTEQVERYARLRGRLEAPLPSFDARRDAWSLMLTRRYLASAIRSARINARQGEIFTPPVADMFRGLIAEAIYAVDIEGLVDEELGPVVDLRVNEPVPAWALAAVPEALLERLPAPTAGIEYRIVNGALVLWDMHAEIVIDALSDAFIGE